MKKLVIIALITMTALVALLAGCDDRGRGVPTRPDIERWSVDPTNRVFSDSVSHTGSPGVFPEADLLLQIGNPFSKQKLEVYIPAVAFGPPARHIPTLILLSPEHEFGNNSDWYYFQRGLFQIAEEMIATGEIQPMMIVAFGNNETFGGFWYGNSYPAGFYDHLLGVELLDRFSKIYPLTFMNDPAKIGIGGFGQGAYGAFRAALMNPGVFGSISAVDGPLDFDGGAGFGNGLIDLVPQVFSDQGLTETNFRTQFDSVSSSPVSRMFIGGSLAFSPHDTALAYTIIDQSPEPPAIIIHDRLFVDHPQTLIDGLVKNDQRGLDFDFHLPFDSTGSMVPAIWDDLWLRNDLERLHDAAGGQPLSGVHLWLGTSPEVQRGCHDMTLSWIETLRTKGYAPETFTYTGYEGKPAESGEYVYDLLRKILKFHDEAFGQP